MPDTPSLPELAQRLAVLTAVHDFIGGMKQEARAEVLTGLLDAAKQSGLRGALDVMLPDGTKVATASLKKPPGTKITVTNPTAFAMWVADRFPDQVEHQVRPAFATELLARLVPEGDTGDVVDPATGEFVIGATAFVPKDTTPTQFELRFVAGGRDEVGRQWRQGALKVDPPIAELEES